MFVFFKMSTNACALCSSSNGDLVIVGKVGIESLKHSAKERQERDRALHFNGEVFVHESCRKNYVNKRNIKLAEKPRKLCSGHHLQTKKILRETG